ncbi:hypothetical protein D3C73_967080 [compost metagenome]
MLQRARVVEAEVLHVHQVQCGVATGGLQHDAQGGQGSAGKDMALDEIHRALGLLITLVADGDGLQQHQAVVLEQRGAAAKVERQIAVPDRLDHLDRNQLVEAPAEVAVVFAQDGNALLQAKRLDALPGMGVLRLGQRGGGHPTPMAGGGVDCQAAPAGADLEQMVVGAQREFGADTLELVQLGLLQALLLTVEHCSGVHHGRVQQPLEQGIAQIVMGQDVASRTTPAVAVEPVQQAQDRTTEARQAALEGVEHLQVGDEQAGDRGQVRTAPVAVGIGFAGTDRAVGSHHAPGGLVDDLDLCMQRATDVAEQPLPPLADQPQTALAQVAKLREHGAPGQATEQRRQAKGFANAQGWIGHARTPR